ncbi:hypothetical protein [Paenarthrobacter sp. PH39-S1]|nr:hypothetical protein [Paenarthrobacter sp. PH39-S1]MDJ0358230.1 hypothetical protein [Paenarthrobacter sp. PH39-S1]
MSAVPLQPWSRGVPALEADTIDDLGWYLRRLRASTAPWNWSKSVGQR